MASSGIYEFPCGVVFATRPGLKKFFTCEDARVFRAALCRRYLKPQWDVAPLVSFARTEDALTCGRTL